MPSILTIVYINEDSLGMKFTISWSHSCFGKFDYYFLRVDYSSLIQIYEQI